MFDVTFLDPANIFAEIDAYPPLMRREAVANYVGREVDWPLTFFDAHELGSDRARVVFHVASQGMGFVKGTASLSDYPWLKSFHSGETVHVRGRICNIDTMFIELEISELLPAAAPATDTFQR